MWGSVGRRDELNEIADALVDTEGAERVVADVLAGRGARQDQVRAQARLDAVRAGRVQVTPTLPYKVAMGAMKIAPRWVTARAMRAVPHM